MSLAVRALGRDELADRIEEIAALRIAVFAGWPYLYAGDPAYEARYLRPYLDSPAALVAGAFDGSRLVGVSTATPMEDHAAELGAAFAGRPEPLESIYYGGESLLLPAFRGQGAGGRFFDLREARARELGRAHVAFCSVVRPPDHPLRPENDRGNNAFWARRGYAPVPGAVATLGWREPGDSAERPHAMQFWMRSLP